MKYDAGNQDDLIGLAAAIYKLRGLHAIHFCSDVVEAGLMIPTGGAAWILPLAPNKHLFWEKLAVISPEDIVTAQNSTIVHLLTGVDQIDHPNSAGGFCQAEIDTLVKILEKYDISVA